MMKVDGDQKTINSVMGSVCTLLVFLIIASYTYQKIDVLVTKKDVDI